MYLIIAFNQLQKWKCFHKSWTNASTVEFRRFNYQIIVIFTLTRHRLADPLTIKATDNQFFVRLNQSLAKLKSINEYEVL